MTDDDLWFAGDVGFGLLNGGEEGLLRFCDMLQDTYAGSGSGKDGPNSMYGRWWWHLNYEFRGPEFEVVLEPLRRHVLGRLPFAPGAKVLGRVVTHRRVHSISSAAVEYGCRPSRLRRMLAAAGHLQPSQARKRNALAVFDVGPAAPLLATIGDRMRGTDAMALLGVTSLKPFMEEGLLVPLLGSTERKQRLYEFSRADVERLHRDLFRRAVEVKEAGPGQVGLYDAVTVLKRSIGKMSHVIRDGRATRIWRLQGGYGLKTLLVDVEEMKRLLHQRSYDGLPMHLLMRRLRTKHDTLRNLVIVGAFTPETLISPLTGRSHRVVPLAQIEYFEAEYVFLFALAGERSTHPLTLKRELVRAGIGPAFPPEKIGACIYLRSAVS